MQSVIAFIYFIDSIDSIAEWQRWLYLRLGVNQALICYEAIIFNAILFIATLKKCADQECPYDSVCLQEDSMRRFKF